MICSSWSSARTVAAAIPLRSSTGPPAALLESPPYSVAFEPCEPFRPLAGCGQSRTRGGLGSPTDRCRPLCRDANYVELECGLPGCRVSRPAVLHIITGPQGTVPVRLAPVARDCPISLIQSGKRPFLQPLATSIDLFAGTCSYPASCRVRGNARDFRRAQNYVTLLRDPLAPSALIARVSSGRGLRTQHSCALYIGVAMWRST
jgi:hypothetical protein